MIGQKKMTSLTAVKCWASMKVRFSTVATRGFLFLPTRRFDQRFESQISKWKKIMLKESLWDQGMNKHKINEEIERHRMPKMNAKPCTKSRQSISFPHPKLPQSYARIPKGKNGLRNHRKTAKNGKKIKLKRLVKQRKHYLSLARKSFKNQENI